MSTTMIIVLSVVGLLVLAGLIVLYLLVPAFRQWIKTKGKDALLKLLKEYVLDQAQVLAELEIPKIAAKVVRGELRDKKAIKAELYGLGAKLKDRVKEHFGSDLQIFGKSADGLIDDLIRAAADRTSPFPGKETAAMLLEDKVSNELVSYGVEWAKDRFLKPAVVPGDSLMVAPVATHTP